AHRSVRAVRGIREARQRSRWSSPGHLLKDAGHQLAETALGVLSFLVVEIETAFAEEGETDRAELGVQIAQLGFAVRARLLRLAAATVIASATEVMGEFGLASTRNSAQGFGPTFRGREVHRLYIRLISH